MRQIHVAVHLLSLIHIWEESAYKKIPVITDFTDEDGNDRMKETVQANYRRIKEEVKPVSYTHLDVYKRQGCVLNGSRMGKELSANALQEHFTLPYLSLIHIF